MAEQNETQEMETRVVALTMGRHVGLSVVVTLPKGTSPEERTLKAWEVFYQALEASTDPGDSHGPLVAAQQQLLRVATELRTERAARERAELRVLDLEEQLAEANGSVDAVTYALREGRA